MTVKVDVGHILFESCIVVQDIRTYEFTKPNQKQSLTNRLKWWFINNIYIPYKSIFSNGYMLYIDGVLEIDDNELCDYIDGKIECEIEVI